MQLAVTVLDADLNVVIFECDDIAQTLEKMDSQLMGRAFQLEDYIGDTRISTVFIPQMGILNIGYHFETAVFAPNDSVQIIARYQTVQEARKGHNQCVAALVI